MACATCGADNRATARFCRSCGATLEKACPSCGAPAETGQSFCDSCGARLSAGSTSTGTAPEAQPQAAPVAERRFVSVLFADLVGFTTLSESRDAEDARELLSRYFDTCRQLIERYGGTVEKFIGDAVMAVWGTPIANEDDAERAVRASLDLVAAVSALGDEVGAPELSARAGVLTGEAAVTLGATGQGMVAGDLVNSASRIQSEAEPGTVLVGDSTKRSSDAAIVYDDAGLHTLKGKAEPMQLWRAMRVVGTRGGVVKSTALEPAFVGRDSELRLAKESFHAAVEDRKAHLVSVVGVGGIGKSRLAWEFEKYIDGLVADTWWHSGRCLAYGDGVAFWALAEMIRGRAGIVEDEDSRAALAKLHAALERLMPEAQERRFVAPRLGHLLGLEESAAGDQENLFAAARMFFERLADSSPTVLLFEDIHWADSALLDFIEYLLDWSRDLPIFILTLARPELLARRSTWGAGKRNFTSIMLEPLPAEAMEVLLTGPVPGLPEELRDRILTRAEGVPFYAVETVRMLLDRGLIVREGNSYRPTGEIETLEVPETLQALIAARLDGLASEERRLVQDAAVLGRTFTLRGLAAVTGWAEAELAPLLQSLIRKEVVSLSADPLSPERGQYGFLQDLVKKVAYDTLSRRDRKLRHLAAAAYLRSLGDDEEVVEVVAAHYLDAYHAAPDDPDAADVKAEARDMLVRAAERAASLGANAEAQRSFERAIDLTDDPLVQADLHEHAGMMAYAGTRADEASMHYGEAIALFEASEATHAAARVSARLAEVMWDRGRIEQGLESMDRAFQVLAEEEPDSDLAALAAQLGRFMFFAGDLDVAMERVETALDMAEALWLPEVLSQALNTKAIILVSRERSKEGLALLRYSLDVALENDKPSAAIRAYFNLADTLGRVERFEDSAAFAREGLALARKVGNRNWEWFFLGQGYALFALGDWDQVLELQAGLPKEGIALARLAYASGPVTVAPIHVHRGELEQAAEIITRLVELEHSADVQERTEYAAGKARVLLGQGDPAEALTVAEEAWGARSVVGITSESVKEAFVVAVEASLEIGDLAHAAGLVAAVDTLPPGRSPQFLQAQAARFRARLAAERGDAAEADRLFKRASAHFRELSIPFYRAVTELEHAEWLLSAQRADDAAPLLTDASEVFEHLAARPWLERAAALSGRETASLAP